MAQALGYVAFYASVAWAEVSAAVSWGSFLAAAGTSVASSLLQQSLVDQPSDPGIKLNTRSTAAEIGVVYGQDLVGGNDVVIEPEAVSYHSLWIVQTISEGECDSVVQDGGVDQVFLDDKLPSEYGTYAAGGNAQVWFVPGSSTQSYGATDGLSHIQAGISKYTENYRNTALLIWKLHYSPDNYNSVPVRTVLLKGRKLYDFRDPPSTAWSDNPVLALYDYLTNTRYGLGYASSEIDTTTWTSAANYCDTKGWTINTTFKQKNAWAVINKICTLFRGQLVWYDGKFYLRYADLNYESSALTVTDDHIVQDSSGKAAISISQPTRFDRPDALRGTFINPNKNYTLDHVIVGEALGNIDNLDLSGASADATAVAAGDISQVASLAVYNLERRQLDRTVSFTGRDDCVQLEPHDVITFTSTALGITAQLMRVVQSDIRSDYHVDIVLQYEDSELYDDDYDLDIEGTYDCTLPDPFTVAAPTNLACAASIVYLDGSVSPTSKIVLTWTASDAEDIVKYILEYKLNADSTWLALGSVNISSDGDDTTFTHFGLPSGVYDFRVAAKNSLARISAWNTITSQTVGDMSAAMPTIQNLLLVNRTTASATQFFGGDARFKWDASGDARFLHYKVEIRDSDDTLVRTEYVTDNRYTYTYEMHVEDINSARWRTVRIDVYEVGTDSQISAAAATLTVVNPAPDMSSHTPTITAAFKGVFVDWSAFTPSDEDVLGYKIYADDTDGSSDLSLAVDANTKKYRLLQYMVSGVLTDITYGDTAHVTIMPFDIFGNGTASLEATGSPVLLPGADVDITATLTSTITMSDSDSTAAATLLQLFDKNLGTTVHSYGNTNDWIKYEYGLYEYITRIIICTNDANGRVYFKIIEDDDTVHYLSGEADHTLDADLELINNGTDDTTAATNYWQLASGFNQAIIPGALIGKSVEVFFANSTVTAVCEFIPVRTLIGEMAVVMTLVSEAIFSTAITIKSGGSIQSENYPTSGYLIDDTGATIKSGSITVSGVTGLGDLAAQDTAAYATDITGKPTDLADINASEGSKLSGIAAGATVGANWSTNLTGVSGTTFANELNTVHGVDDNADPTEDAIESSVTITSGGITMSGGGKIVSFNKSTPTSSTAGFYMGYYGSTYQFGMGTNTKYIHWDGTDLNVEGSIIASGNIKANNLTQIGHYWDGNYYSVSSATYSYYGSCGVYSSASGGNATIIATIEIKSNSSTARATADVKLRNNTTSTDVSPVKTIELPKSGVPVGEQADTNVITIMGLDWDMNSGTNYFKVGVSKKSGSSADIRIDGVHITVFHKPSSY